ncbi:MAG: MBL fold metallo-hydrolase [Chitinophagaceae bacterium]|nr:MAG: MBL fold metallo-hydrolase [Chitinophagaceae bacterium]
MKKSACILLLVLLSHFLLAQPAHQVKNLKITILSTMLAQKGMGEWGFAALVEADSVKILFDAGSHEKTVLENSKLLNIDLSQVPRFVISHNHWDHTIGWMPLRNEISRTNRQALSVTHVGKGIFDTRLTETGGDETKMRQDSALYVQSGGKIITHASFAEISPGIYVTGPVARKYPEKNYDQRWQKKDAAGKTVADIVPEDMSLIILTAKGLVLLSGCGHSGIINTITQARDHLQQETVYAAIGGFHLLQNSDEQIRWTADELKKAGIRYFMGAHCTGIEPVYQIREWAGLKRGESVVGSVGATFDLVKGFTPGALAR